MHHASCYTVLLQMDSAVGAGVQRHSEGLGRAPRHGGAGGVPAQLQRRVCTAPAGVQLFAFHYASMRCRGRTVDISARAG